MRYAVYIAGEDGLFEFSSSYRDLEHAKTQAEIINAWRTNTKAIVILVHDPEQRIDPYAASFWKTKEPA
jgi:hypothetical protein